MHGVAVAENDVSSNRATINAHKNNEIFQRKRDKEIQIQTDWITSHPLEAEEPSAYEWSCTSARTPNKLAIQSGMSVFLFLSSTLWMPLEGVSFICFNWSHIMCATAFLLRQTNSQSFLSIKRTHSAERIGTTMIFSLVHLAERQTFLCVHINIYLFIWFVGPLGLKQQITRYYYGV